MLILRDNHLCYYLFLWKFSMESQRLITPRAGTNSENGSSDEEECSDGSSYNSSYYSDSDR
ncbi:hypothetical protein NQ314_014366 [Rhamnusium bicolor]|uniref:Uncharacterized protein n=1 Tax=Rhamnusium bicolor TaxID=1586634 RepID=A0AAV8X3C0_9CUCU|nr:hypothetical protein NQ314_014366 [Rhamnusium bicolor]